MLWFHGNERANLESGINIGLEETVLGSSSNTITYDLNCDLEQIASYPENSTPDP